MSLRDQFEHVPIEEGQEEGADVAAVYVGVAEQYHLVVAEPVKIELIAETSTDGLDQGLDLGVLEHPVDPGSFYVEDLPPDGEHGHCAWVAGLHRRAAGRITFHNQQF